MHHLNMADMREKLRGTLGEKDAMAVLTEAKVRELRIRYGAGGLTQSELAEEFGCSQSAVSAAILKTSWRHV
jgi:DNA-binding MarR family transcriptional regulator